MPGTLQPLDSKFAIVDRNGNPTEYFTRWAQQKQIDIGDSITLTDLQAYLTAHKLIQGTGIQLTPDGDINDGVTIHADVQAILDEITATRGAVLYRGLLGWAALLPGTAGLFLQTSGAGADPVWAVASGGGGSIEAYFARDTTTVSTGTVPTAQTAFYSLVIPAAAVARTFAVSGGVVWDNNHGMRWSVQVDTVRNFPSTMQASNPGINPPSITGDGMEAINFSGLPIVIPGDGAAHTISMAWEAQLSTSALNLRDRYLTAIKIA